MSDARPLPAVPAALDGVAHYRHISATVSAALRVAAETTHRNHAVIMSADGETVRTVRNLGWLMRHRSELLAPSQGPAFTIRGWRYAPRAGVLPVPVEHHGPVLLAHLADGRTFACTFADASVLFDWLDRPSFAHLSATVNLRSYSRTPSTCAVGGLDWPAMSPSIATG